MDKLNQELKKINKDIQINLNNLIYLLNHVNIEYINLIEYHYTFLDLINKRNDIEKIIHDKKIKELYK